MRGAAVIHLGLPLPATSCGLPASIGRAALDRSRREPLAPLLTLLRVGFTEPPQSPATLVVSYTTVSPLPRRWRRGGLFSVALSRGSPRVGVTDHPALWSPDLPHRACARRDRPADSPVLRIRRRGQSGTPRLSTRSSATAPFSRIRKPNGRGRTPGRRPGRRMEGRGAGTAGTSTPYKRRGQRPRAGSRATAATAITPRTPPPRRRAPEGRPRRQAPGRQARRQAPETGPGRLREISSRAAGARCR